jgi:hypothetical protein
MRRATRDAARPTWVASAARAVTSTSPEGNVRATAATGCPPWSSTAQATDANPGVTDPSS